MPTHMTIPGPAGALEAQLDRAPRERTITAILCHPHPQYGGNMLDSVLDTVAQVLLAAGVNCLRFNFRGVGASEGKYADGIGEVDDLVAVHAWIAAEYPRDKVWLAGYSFGSHVVWRALEQIDHERAFLIAPPVGMMDFSGNGEATQVQAIAGDKDDFVDAGQLTAWLGDAAYLIPGADHFFAGMHQQLHDTLEQALTAR